MDIASFWRAVLDQQAGKISPFFHKNAVIRWHCTNEQFSVEEFIRANCEYPGEWDGQIERIEEKEDLLITVVRVFLRDHSASFHAVSFFLLEQGKIISLDEYWADDGEAPQWRQEMGVGCSMKETQSKGMSE